jgi:hypothetical protein
LRIVVRKVGEGAGRLGVVVRSEVKSWAWRFGLGGIGVESWFVLLMLVVTFDVSPVEEYRYRVIWMRGKKRQEYYTTLRLSLGPCM